MEQSSNDSNYLGISQLKSYNNANDNDLIKEEPLFQILENLVNESSIQGSLIPSHYSDCEKILFPKQPADPSYNKEEELYNLARFLKSLNILQLNQIRAFLEYIGFNNNENKKYFDQGKLIKLLKFFTPLVPNGNNKPQNTISYYLIDVCYILNSGYQE